MYVGSVMKVRGRGFLTMQWLDGCAANKVSFIRFFFQLSDLCAAGGHTLSCGPASASASAPGRDRDKMDIRAPDLVGYKRGIEMNHLVQRAQGTSCRLNVLRARPSACPLSAVMRITWNPRTALPPRRCMIQGKRRLLRARRNVNPEHAGCRGMGVGWQERLSATPLALAAVAESAGPIAGGGPAKGTSQSCLAADAAS